MKKTLAAFAALTLCFATAAGAVTVHPTSYNMRNGDTGIFSHWDDSYTGRGNTEQDNARLRRGLGDLTDGVVATGNWNAVEGPEGGPYVGWENRTQRIVFRFDETHAFNSAIFHFDSNGGGGGANAPQQIIINGQGASVVAPGTDPFAFMFDLSELDPTDTLIVRIRRARSSEWTFLSEVRFDASVPAVPLPASGLMLFAAVAGAGLIGLRKNRH